MWHNGSMGDYLRQSCDLCGWCSEGQWWSWSMVIVSHQSSSYHHHHHYYHRIIVIVTTGSVSSFWMVEWQTAVSSLWLIDMDQMFLLMTALTRKRAMFAQTANIIDWHVTYNKSAWTFWVQSEFCQCQWPSWTNYPVSFKILYLRSFWRSLWIMTHDNVIWGNFGINFELWIYESWMLVDDVDSAICKVWRMSMSHCCKVAPLLLQVLTFVVENNKLRKQQGLAPFRFADLYHSANRTPVATREAAGDFGGNWALCIKAAVEARTHD